MIKNTYSIQWKIPGQTLFFKTSASCSKILNVKSTFHTVKIFRATLFFTASASCWKILNDKKYFNTVKNSRATLFFMASASCSKIVNNVDFAKKFWIYSMNSGHPLFFRASASCSKLRNVKSMYSIQWKTSGQLCFSGQAQVAQKSWTVKKFGGDPCNLD